MKFVSVFLTDRSRLTDPPTQKEMADMGQLIGEMQQAGVLLDSGGVMAGGASLRVRRGGTNVTVTDGPFAETKEVIGGFALLKVQSKDEAASWARRFLECAGDGMAELHEVTEIP